MPAPTPELTPERWRAVKAVVQAALERPAAERAAFVAEACAGDPALRAEVASLLAKPDTGELSTDFLAPAAAAALAAAGAAALEAVADAPFASAIADRYAVERAIARGGAATVYLARDLRHGRAVAVKAFAPALSAALGAERFRREIAVTAALHHPHILPLFDSGEAAGRLYYVTPYVDGGTLRARLARGGPLPPGEAVRLARQIAAALAHAHARGVVHRDVKPENVLLQRGVQDGPHGGHVLVADFGIALAAEQAEQTGGARLTRTGLLVGTPQYMAPEQAAGDRAVDARADVYALGAVLYEALAGEPPFAGPTAHAVAQRVLGEVPRPLAARAPAVPPGVEAAVMTALAKAPADRFPSAAAFAAALERGIEGGLAQPTPGVDADPRAARSPVSEGSRSEVPRRRDLPVAAVALLTAGALAAGTLLGWTAHDAANRAEHSAAAPVRARVREARAPATGDPAANAGAVPRLVVVDRSGRLVQELPAQVPWTPRFSPDGGRVAYGAFAPDRDGSELWVADLRTGTARRLTGDGRDDNDPQWSPDGRRLAYSAAADGGKDLFVRAVDGGVGGAAGAFGAAPALSARGGDQFPTDWLPDGSGVLLTEQAGGGLDVLVQPADGGAARPYAATAARESAARASPDGRWVAYTSDETGRSEVYVDAYPTPGRRTRVSAAGGEHPVWARDGRTLYYWQGTQLIAARVEPDAGGGPPRVRAREALFRAAYAGGVIAMYDVSPDGQRVVLVTGDGR